MTTKHINNRQRKCLFSILTLGFLSLTGPSYLAAVSVDGEEALSPDAAKETREIVELANDRFQFALKPEVGTTPPMGLNDAIEWEYAGQAVYARPDAANREAQTKQHKIIQDEGPTDLYTRLMRTEMEDEHGRIFRVKHIDKDKLTAGLENYNARMAVEFGNEESGLDVNDRANSDLDLDVGARYTPLTWYRNDQDGDGDEDRFRWDSDDRNLVSSPLTARQEKTVAYFFGDSGTDGGTCTGVMIASYWVLTAAHCAKTSSGSAWIYADGAGEARRGKVCTRGNYYSGAECANVVARFGNGSWGGSGDMGDDLVVMEIDQPLGQGNYMALSQAGNSTLKSHDAYNSGYPGLTPNGSNNLLGCTLFAGDPVGGDTNDALAPCEKKMYWDNNEVNKTSSKIIGTKVDMSSGHSGGPIYYYPNGVSPNASHYLTGIVSGHSQGATKSYNGGPKIPYHRSWIQGVCGC